MRHHHYFLLLGVIAYCYADSRILEHYEKKLNNLTKKLNNGKPVIVNGKMKRYKCIEEYIPVDDIGSIMEMEDGKNTSQEISQSEPKGGGHFSYSTSTAAYEYRSSESEALSPNGLKIQKLKKADVSQYKQLAESKKYLTDSRSIPVDSEFESAEVVEARPEIRRTHVRKPSRYEYRRPLPSDYEDYQYFDNEMAPEYTRRQARPSYYYSRNRQPQLAGVPMFEPRRPLPLNNEDYVDRHYSAAVHKPLRPPSEDIEKRWRRPDQETSRRQPYIQQTRPLRPLPVAGYPSAFKQQTTTTIPTLSPTIAPTTPPSRPPRKPSLQMTPENCQKVKSFANSFFVSDPQKWIRQNCGLAKTFVPDPRVSCEDLVTFVDSCYRHHFFK